MESDCNLELYSLVGGVTGGSLWTSGTANMATGCYADFQPDGNLVVYDGGGTPLWASGTSGTVGAELHLQADGNVVIYNGAGGALWQTYTNYPSEYTLFAGQLTMVAGQILHSQNRKLEMSSDCNLRLYSFENGVTGGVLWSSQTAGAGTGCYADFQADGNFVVYDEFDVALWASGTSGTSGAELRLQDDGNLVVYNGVGQPLWSSSTNTPSESIFTAGGLTLTAGQWVQTQNRKLEMQTDCDLVLFSVANALVGGSLWSSQTAGAGTGCYADFQGDGNFVVYDGGASPLWASGTSGTSGAELRLQDDGNLVVYNGVNQPLWSTSTNTPSQSTFAAGGLSLTAGQFVQTQTRKLEMQADCNLVLYNVANAQVGGVLWHSGTFGAGTGCYVDFQGDGNLVVYDGGGQPLWASGTSGTSGAELWLQSDGNLVIYNGVGLPLWDTNTPGTFISTGVCGDFACDGSETCGTCPGDCGPCSAVCGDFACDGGETCSSCPGDCGSCGGAFCGDLSCNGSETCSSCPGDCGSCAPVCGDLTCDGGETCSTCPGDCGTCAPPVCGDLACNGSETCATCAGDCGTCPPPVCGDFACNGAEACFNCAVDCGSCGGAGVPTLSEWGFGALVVALSGAALVALPRRRQG
jgi:hypothetical protein